MGPHRGGEEAELCILHPGLQLAFFSLEFSLMLKKKKKAPPKTSFTLKMKSLAIGLIL